MSKPQDLERQLAESRQRALDLAAQLEETDRRAGAAEQALANAKADAESWYEQCEAARDALIKLGRDTDAQIAVLADTITSALRHYETTGNIYTGDNALIPSLYHVLTPDVAETVARYREALHKADLWDGIFKGHTFDGITFDVCTAHDIETIERLMTEYREAMAVVERLRWELDREHYKPQNWPGNEVPEFYQVRAQVLKSILRGPQ